LQESESGIILVPAGCRRANQEIFWFPQVAGEQIRKYFGSRRLQESKSGNILVPAGSRRVNQEIFWFPQVAGEQTAKYFILLSLLWVKLEIILVMSTYMFSRGMRVLILRCLY
jgi:hypothetical protein